MTLAQSINGLPKPLRYGLWGLVIGIPAAGLIFIAYDLISGGQHESATFKEMLVQKVHLCPSLKNKTKEDFYFSADIYEDDTNCHSPDIADNPCDGEPEIGIIQVRACTNIIPTKFEGMSIYGLGCPLGKVDTIEMHPVYPGTGVIYVEQEKGLDVIHHALGHAIGLGWPNETREDGHSTREDSVMFIRPGYSFKDVSCD